MFLGDFMHSEDMISCYLSPSLRKAQVRIIYSKTHEAGSEVYMLWFDTEVAHTPKITATCVLAVNIQTSIWRQWEIDSA